LSTWVVSDCLVLGRYTIYRGMSARSAAALVSTNPAARATQTVAWRIKKVVKQLSGLTYLRIRLGVLKHIYPDTKPTSR
jgi:hypothetical protein